MSPSPCTTAAAAPGASVASQSATRWVTGTATTTPQPWTVPGCATSTSSTASRSYEVSSGTRATGARPVPPDS